MWEPRKARCIIWIVIIMFRWPLKAWKHIYKPQKVSRYFFTRTQSLISSISHFHYVLFYSKQALNGIYVPALHFLSMKNLLRELEQWKFTKLKFSGLLKYYKNSLLSYWNVIFRKEAKPKTRITKTLQFKYKQIRQNLDL